MGYNHDDDDNGILGNNTLLIIIILVLAFLCFCNKGNSCFGGCGTGFGGY